MPATGAPKTPQIAANAIPATATRQGWRTIMCASRSSIVAGACNSVCQLGVEVRTPGVEADPESQDLQAHRARRLEMRRLLRGEPARDVPVASRHVARQLDSVLPTARVGEEKLQQHLIAELDRRNGGVRDPIGKGLAARFRELV